MSPTQRQDSDSPASPAGLSAAILGCGRVAGAQADPARRDLALCHAAGYRDAGVALAACCDTDPAAAADFARRWGVARTYAEPAAMLVEARPGLLSICSPTPLHAAHLRLALDAGVPAILVEKPLAAATKQGTAEARDLLDRAAAAPSRVAVNYFRRFNPALAGLRRSLLAGDLGEPQRVQVLYNKGLAHNGSHCVDLVRWFFGEFAQVRSLRARGPAEDPDLDLDCRMESGLPVSFAALDHAAYNLIEVDMLLTGGRVRLTNSGRVVLLQSPEPDSYFPHLRFLGQPHDLADNSWRTVYAHTMAHLAALARGQEKRPTCTLADGLAALEVCRAARESLDRNRAISPQALPGAA